MNRLKLNSYAKINLNLKILTKRPDGYHNIKSVVQTISLKDTVKLKKNKKIICKTNVKNIPTDEKNLAFKAAKIFFNHTKIEAGVKIIIKKKIPTQSGLGGGSSNAAATLIGLNKLFKTNLTKAELLKLAKKIGADVPFLVSGGTALMQGFGELIKNIKPIKNCYILIIKPNFNISTKEAYLKYYIFASNFEKNSLDFVKNLCVAIEKEKSFKEIKKFLINDFEKVLKNENIKKIKKEMLEKGAICCSLTGSGSAIFAIFKEKNKAKLAKNFFKKQKLKTFLTTPIKTYYNFNLKYPNNYN